MYRFQTKKKLRRNSIKWSVALSDTTGVCSFDVRSRTPTSTCTWNLICIWNWERRSDQKSRIPTTPSAATAAASTKSVTQNYSLFRSQLYRCVWVWWNFSSFIFYPPYFANYRLQFLSLSNKFKKENNKKLPSARFYL